MKRLLQLAAALLLTTTLAPASAPKPPKPAPENVEWIWQYTPDDTTRTAARTISPPISALFRSSSSSSLRRRPSGGSPSTAATARSPRPRSTTSPSPTRSSQDDSRYVSISGCVVHFCPARGLLWIDLNGAHHLVVFAAIDWSKQGRPTSDPAAEYTLWVFPDEPLSAQPTPRAIRPPHSQKPSAAGPPSRSPARASSRTSPTPSSSTPTARPTKSHPPPSAFNLHRRRSPTPTAQHRN